MRSMADVLDFLERHVPHRQAGRGSRLALAEYYGTSPTAAMRTFRRPVSAARVRRAIVSGERGMSGGESTNSDSGMSSSEDEQQVAAFVPGRDDPEDFFKEVRIKTAHKKNRGNATLVGELIRRIEEPDDAE